MTHMLNRAVLLVGWLTASAAVAQPVSRLTTVAPFGAQSGTTIDINIQGEGLEQARALRVSGAPGVTGEIIEGNAADPIRILFSGLGIEHDEQIKRRVSARITIAEGTVPGRRELRVETPWGLSNALNFYVGDIPETTERNDNHTLADAMKVELPATINGRIGRAAEEDFYRFSAAKGERLIFDVLAGRLSGDRKLDATLTLFDAQGDELAEDEDTNFTDPLIDFTAPMAGDYVIRIRDVQSRGDNRFRYRIRAGKLPYLDSIFPLGGRRGSSLDLTFTGRNLGNVAPARISIAKDAPLGSQEIRAAAGGGLTNARRFIVSDLPHQLEREPNDTTAQANSTGWPRVINGRIGKAGDTDQFKIKVDGALTLGIEVQAGRLGSRLDPLLTVIDSEGEVVSRNDDQSGADASLTAQLAEAGEYTIEIRDLLNGGGPNYAYRLSLRDKLQDFSVSFSPDFLRVSCGARSMITAEVNRRGGFGGPVMVRLASAPAGVTAEPIIIPAGERQGLIALTAANDAAIGVGAISLEACGVIEGQREWRAAGGSSMDSFVTVIAGAPFSLELVSLNCDLVQNGSGEIHALVRRHNGFDGEITVYGQGFQDNVSIEAAKLTGDATHARLKISATRFAQTGAKEVLIMARAKIDGSDWVAASETMVARVREIPFALLDTVPRLSLTAQEPTRQTGAGEALLKVQVGRRGWFSEEVKLVIENLPEGVTASEAVIAARETEAVIKLRATPEAQMEKALAIRVKARTEVNGRTFEQTTGDIGLTVTKPVEVASE